MIKRRSPTHGESLNVSDTSSLLESLCKIQQQNISLVQNNVHSPSDKCISWSYEQVLPVLFLFCIIIQTILSYIELNSYSSLFVLVLYVLHKFSDHKLEEKEGSARDVRRRCVGCYEKLRQQQSRDISATTAKRIKTFCPDCEQFFCLDCFNEKHFSK